MNAQIRKFAGFVWQNTLSIPFHFLLNKLKFNERKSFYAQFVKPGNLCFDVGANNGNRTEIFLALDAKVVAIEPQPACFKTLQNRFGKRIFLEQIGLSDKPGSLDMYISTASTLSTFSADWIEDMQKSFSNYEWNKTMKVNVDTLDNLILKYGIPDFCKIDVEGFEYSVLKGLSQPIPLISFEYKVPERKFNIINILNFLVTINSGYKFNYATQENTHFELENFIGITEFISLADTSRFLTSDFGDIYAKVS